MTSQTHSKMASKAGALVDRFRKACTILGLKISFAAFALLEELNRSLQASSSSSSTVSGMLQAIDAVKSQLMRLRTEQWFSELFDAVNGMAKLHDIDPISLPRQRRPT